MRRLYGFCWKHHQRQFLKTNLPPLSPTNLTMNTQACTATVQVSSGTKSKEIDRISFHSVVHIEVGETRIDDPAIVLWEKGIQKSSRIFLPSCSVWHYKGTNHSPNSRNEEVTYGDTTAKEVEIIKWCSHQEEFWFEFRNLPRRY